MAWRARKATGLRLCHAGLQLKASHPSGNSPRALLLGWRGILARLLDFLRLRFGGRPARRTSGRLLLVGEHEMLRDDSVRVAKKALSDGIPVKFEVWPGMVHVFQIRGLPESREAIEQIAEFMRSKLPKP